MLVISRRENEKFLFPSLGITIQVVKVAGKVARIGIEAPPEIRIIREELLVDGQPACLDAKPSKQPGVARQKSSMNGIPKLNDAKVSESAGNYEISGTDRNRQNENPNHRPEYLSGLATITESLKHAQQQLAAGNVDDVAQTIASIVSELQQIEYSSYSSNTGNLPAIENPESRIRNTDSATREQNTNLRRIAILVDGQDTDHSSLGELLHNNSFDVIVVQSAEQAVKLIQQSFQQPEFVLLDLSNKSVNSARHESELIAGIRSDKNMQGIQLFALSQEPDQNSSEFDQWFCLPLEVKEFVLDMQAKCGA